MKNLIAIYAAFLIGISTLISCRNNSEDDTLLEDKTYYLSKMSTANEFDKYSYDSQNRLSNISLSSGLTIDVLEFDNSNRPTKAIYKESGRPDYIYEYFYDNNNRLIEITVKKNGQIDSKLFYTYDNNGFQKDVVLANGELYLRMVAVTEAENPTNITFYNDDNQISERINYTYDNKKNPFKEISLFTDTVIGFTSSNNILGVFSTNLQKQNSYEYNEAGYPIKITSKNLQTNETKVSTLEYVTK